MIFSSLKLIIGQYYKLQDYINYVMKHKFPILHVRRMSDKDNRYSLAYSLAVS